MFDPDEYDLDDPKHPEFLENKEDILAGRDQTERALCGAGRE